MHVVSCWTLRRAWARDGACGTLARKGRFQSLSRFDAGLNDEIRHQTRTDGYHGIVRGVMQPHPVLFRVLPPIGADVIKRGGKLGQCARQRLRLLWSGLECESDRASHRLIIPYAARFWASIMTSATLAVSVRGQSTSVPEAK